MLGDDNGCGSPGTVDVPGEPHQQELPRRRWLISFRAAVLAVCLLVGAAAGLAVFRGGGADGAVSSVELGREGADAADPVPAGTADTGTGSADAPAGADGADGADSAAGSGKAGAAVPRTGESDPAGTGTTGQAAGPSVVVVHVAGAVGRPGVVRIPAGSRAGDAVDAAGGAQADADLTAVNLAAPLQDGMMVVVPRAGEGVGSPPVLSVPGTGAGTEAGSGPAGGAGTAAGDVGGVGAAAGSGTVTLININSASVQELDALPKVGPVIAQRIIDWREDHGRFTRPEDLDAVPGIGEAMMAALLPLITV